MMGFENAATFEVWFSLGEQKVYLFDYPFEGYMEIMDFPCTVFLVTNLCLDLKTTF